MFLQNCIEEKEMDFLKSGNKKKKRINCVDKIKRKLKFMDEIKRK